MAPIDRSCTTYYWSAIVSMALYLVPFSSYLTLNNIVTLKSRSGVIRSHEMTPFDRSHSFLFVFRCIAIITANNMVTITISRS